MKNIIAIALMFLVLPAFAGSPESRASGLAEGLIAYQLSGPLCHMKPAPPEKRAELAHAVSRISRPGMENAAKLTPIDYAVLANDARGVDRLIALGYNPRHQFNNPLTGAALFGAPQAMKALLSAGVDPNRMYPDGSVPLLAAIEQNRQALVKELFNAGARPNPALQNGASLLDFAMPCKDQALISLLLSHGVTPSSRTAGLARKFGLSLTTAHER